MKIKFLVLIGFMIYGTQSGFAGAVLSKEQQEQQEQDFLDSCWELQESILAQRDRRWTKSKGPTNRIRYPGGKNPPRVRARDRKISVRKDVPLSVQCPLLDTEY